MGDEGSRLSRELPNLSISYQETIYSNLLFTIVLAYYNILLVSQGQKHKLKI